MSEQDIYSHPYRNYLMLQRNSGGEHAFHRHSEGPDCPLRLLAGGSLVARTRPLRRPPLRTGGSAGRSRPRAASARRPLQQRLLAEGEGRRHGAGRSRRRRLLTLLPLAPAHRFPDALDSIYVALEALARACSWAARKAPLYVAGEEAGGNLAAALAMVARDRGGPALAGQILLSPMLDSCLGTASLRAAHAGPVGCQWADGWADYLGAPERGSPPYATPLNAARLAGLPPALLLSAQDDPMRDEVAQYAALLTKAGVAVNHIVEDAPTHWPRAFAEAPRKDSCLCSARGAIADFYARTAPS